MSERRPDLEGKLLFQLRAAGLPLPMREHLFCPGRRWRFDFAYPDEKVAVECEGGTWNGGRHVHPLGFENDCMKYGEAAICGWKVIRVTGQMIADGRALRLVERALKGEADAGD